jgi:hypothetical protein
MLVLMYFITPSTFTLAIVSANNAIDVDIPKHQPNPASVDNHPRYYYGSTIDMDVLRR